MGVRSLIYGLAVLVCTFFALSLVGEYHLWDTEVIGLGIGWWTIISISIVGAIWYFFAMYAEADMPEWLGYVVVVFAVVWLLVGNAKVPEYKAVMKMASVQQTTSQNHSSSYHSYYSHYYGWGSSRSTGSSGVGSGSSCHGKGCGAGALIVLLLALLLMAFLTPTGWVVLTLTSSALCALLMVHAFVYDPERRYSSPYSHR